MELMELVGKLKSRVDEVVKLALPKGEADTRFKKIETDLESCLKALREEAVRKTTLPSFAGDGVGAGGWLAREGVKSIKDLSQTRIYDTDPITGQTVKRLLVPLEVENALKVIDEMFIVEKLLGFKYGDSFHRAKAEWEGGPRGFYLEGGGLDDGKKSSELRKLARRYDEVVKGIDAYHGKALTATGAGTGDEWVPTILATNLLDIIRLSMPVTNLVPHLNQPSNPWQNPILNGVNIAYRKLENTNITASDLSTAARTWTAHIFAVYQAFSDEVDEDSAVAIASAVRTSIIRTMGEGLDEALVNGDSDNAAHFDNDYIAGGAPFRTYQGGVDGLRHFALDSAGTGTDNTVDGGADAISYVDVGAGLATMGKFGANKIANGDVVALTNAQQWIQLLTEASSPIATVDLYGPKATILTGEVGRIYGVPIFVSHGMEQRKDSVASTGQNTVAGPNTLSCAAIFNRMNFRIGDRRDFKFERDKDIVAGRIDTVASARWSLMPIEGDTSDANWDPQGTPAVVVIRNVD